MEKTEIKKEKNYLDTTSNEVRVASLWNGHTPENTWNLIEVEWKEEGFWTEVKK